ncbi:murein biosynthesis integral membrane protein MurJ [Lysinibacter cavernae]|uniref:Putative peptidoglycan lipid II flippase n=1 Tax=Lysinibacter cavernae TaxID=1640652 RepID=A0A7X5R2T2_9MICO|nr:lipid II flippase MurJ [Lysinibacter cavernae]NIH54633.1 putative peptidoglycan lipid II flippase [Lysinibacter cavernae]
MTTPTDNIGKASVWLASGTVVSRLLGFLKIMVLAQTIGSVGVGTNAFALANSLPNNVYLIIAGGVLNAILVPHIVRAAKGFDGGASYINKLVTLAIVVLGATTAIAVVLTPVIVTIYSAASSEAGTDGAGLALAIALGYWCMPQILFYGLYTVLGEILNARRMFGPFTWAPILNNVIGILGLILFTVMFGADPNGDATVADWTPDRIAVLGGSTTLGVIAQAAILLVFWKRAGLKFKLDFKWKGVGLRSAGRASVWAFGIMIAAQLTLIVTTNVAYITYDTKLPSLFISTTAWLIFALPHSIITVSITTAHFTRMSEHATAKDFPAVRKDFSEIVRSVCLLITLTMFGMVVLAMPLSKLFVKEDSQLVGMTLVLIANMIWLVFFTIVFVAQRTFYALGDTRTPFFFFLFQYALQAILSVGVGMFVPHEYLVVGLAIAQGVSTLATMPIALGLLRKRIPGGLDGKRVTRTLLQYFFAGAVAAVVGYFVTNLLGGNTPGAFGTANKVTAIIVMSAVGVVMSAIYFAILHFMRSSELKEFAAPIMRRLGR